MKYKYVFWDWDGVLVSNLYLKNFFINASKKSEINSLISNCEPVFISHNWELVLKFASLNCVQIVVSNGSYLEIINQLKFASFKDFCLVLSADYHKAKPDVEMFEYAKAKCNFKFNECVFFGDSKTDELAAKKLNMQFYFLNENFINTINVIENELKII